jgi:hypothetical protein
MNITIIPAMTANASSWSFVMRYSDIRAGTPTCGFVRYFERRSLTGQSTRDAMMMAP